MTTVFMIVDDVGPHKADEMPLAKDDDVLEEVATTTQDPTFGGPVLPWTVESS